METFLIYLIVGGLLAWMAEALKPQEYRNSYGITIIILWPILLAIAIVGILMGKKTY